MGTQTSNTSKANYAYNSEELSCTSEEYKFVKNFFETTVNKDFDYFGDLKDQKKLFFFKSDEINPKYFEVHKISEKNRTESTYGKANNLMLFHGTKEKYVEGILKRGFENSRQGWFGKGVYMTDCSSSAAQYTEWTSQRRQCCVFVNEVLHSNFLRRFEHEDIDEIDYPVCTEPEYPFEKLK